MFNINGAIFLPFHEPNFQLIYFYFQPPFHHIPKTHHKEFII